MKPTPKKAGDVTEDEFLDDDYVDDDDLYDYARLDRSADEDNGISVSVNADASEELTKEEAEEDASIRCCCRRRSWENC